MEKKKNWYGKPDLPLFPYYNPLKGYLAIIEEYATWGLLGGLLLLYRCFFVLYCVMCFFFGKKKKKMLCMTLTLCVIESIDFPEHDLTLFSILFPLVVAFLIWMVGIFEYKLRLL